MVKYKYFKITDVVILDYKEKPFTMLVGKQLSNDQYKPLANVEFGFKPEEKEASRQIAKQIITKLDRNMIWLEPSLTCKVQYLEKAKTGMLRITSFKVFSFDNLPVESIA